MNDSESQSTLVLEDNLTVMTAVSLVDSLKTLKGSPTRLDASNVNHLDLPALQVLLAASAAWKSNNDPFEIMNISENFQVGLDTLGVNLSALNSAEAL